MSGNLGRRAPKTKNIPSALTSAERKSWAFFLTAGRRFGKRRWRRRKSRKEFVSALLGVADEMTKDIPRRAFIGIGAGAAGISDPKRQKMVLSPNIPAINGLKIGELLNRRFHLKTRLDNDARCFLRAEMGLGKAKKRKNTIGVTLGTGVGGAVAVGGKIIFGADFSAGEMGHMVLNAATGETFEDLASEKFLKRRFRGEPADLEILAAKAIAALAQFTKRLEKISVSAWAI